MKLTFTLLFNFIITLVFGQYVFPFHKVEFKDYTPKWLKYSIDETFDQDLVHSDDSNFYLQANQQDLSFIDGAYLYKVITVNPYIVSGTYIEKINIQTGDLIWKQIYNLKNNGNVEIPKLAYINNEHQLEIINYHLFINFAFPANIEDFVYNTSKIHFSKRTFDLDTGDFIDHSFLKGDDASAFEFTLNTGPKYISRTDDDNIEVVTSNNTTAVKVGKDGTLLETIDNISNGLPDQIDYTKYWTHLGDIKSSTKNIIALNYIYSRKKDNDYYLSLQVFDKKWNLEKKLSIVDYFKDSYKSLHLTYVDDDFIVLDTHSDNSTQFTVLDYSGKLVNRFSLPNATFDQLGTIHFKLDRIKNTSKFIIVSTSTTKDGKSTGSNKKMYIEFLVTDQNGQLNKKTSFELKDKFYNDFLFATHIYQLENQDIIVGFRQAVDSIIYLNNNYFGGQFGTWYNSIYFSKSDLNLPTANSDISEFADMTIYPNPASEKIIISLPNKITGKFSIFNSQGKVVLKENIFSKNQIDIKVNSFPKGVYFIQFNSQNGKLFKGKSFIRI